MKPKSIALTYIALLIALIYWISSCVPYGVTIVHSPSPTHTAVVQKNTCVELLESQPEGLQIKGTLVLGNSSSRNPYFLNLFTGEEISFLEDTYGLAENFVVSPDRNYIAFTAVHNNNATQKSLIVASAEGAILLEYARDPDQWTGIQSWQNQDTILLWIFSSKQSSLAAFDLSSKTIRPLPDSYPNLDIDAAWGLKKWRGLIIYNYQMEKLIYPKIGWGDTNTYVLWDVNQEQALLEIPNIIYSDTPPAWSNDGSRFVFTSENLNPQLEELTLVDSQLKVTQLTNLGQDYTHPNIRNFAWSPDGRYIGMILGHSTSSRIFTLLIIIDVETGKATNTCLQVFESSQIIWSPDSQYIAVNAGKQNRPITALVDPFHRNVWVVTEKFEPLGWLNSK